MEETRLLVDILNDFENGILDMTQGARKCYLTEEARAAKRETWVHNDELKAQCILYKIAVNHLREIIKDTKEQKK